ncbi:MAG: Asp-tRNA(Asn)/Glu-tRNA(Gln) amidotransferase subunit GatC [Bdellovibrionaceae bacterium]|nr:Asp-tRNA(Asn)/Glu-tRNA(Gln) amidotransferase subunit GatC [Pseudobdellovibrionaceae bacterium]NUM57554.1 Asp-tRNA(Asn)/Glu-tRNA(Gln) amidotransferase subunit GatC [Pseudobdellovibrionaceae bacterium]
MIDKKIINNIAKLSRIELDEVHAVQYAKDLSRVLEYFNQISNINTNHIEPMTTPLDQEKVLRKDVVNNIYTPEEMLANAPAKAGNLFKVPPVV